jgi:hypothetical protein
MILPLQLWLRGAFASDQPSPKAQAPSRRYRDREATARNDHAARLEPFLMTN